MPRFKDIKNAEDSNVLRLPPHSLPHSRSAPSPAIARAPPRTRFLSLCRPASSPVRLVPPRAGPSARARIAHARQPRALFFAVYPNPLPRARISVIIVSMKKIASAIVLVVVVSVLAVTFAACNNATTQGQLVDAWKEGRPYERYTYSVNDSAYDGVEGTYVSEIFYHAAYNAETAPEKVTVGDSTFEQREGYLIRSTLEATLDGKAHLIVTECYFSLTDGSSYLLPSATFRSESVDDNEVLRMNGTYSGNSLSYTLKTADGEKKGSIGLGSVFYDNNEFHQSLRGVSTFSTSFSFGFSTAVVNATEQTSASLTLSVSGTENISGLEFDSVGRNEEGAEIASETTSLECYKATLSRSTTVAGASQTLYYTVAPVYAAVNEAGDDTLVSTYDNGWWALPHVLAAIVEPYNDADGNAQTVTYTLTDISLIRPAE